MAGGREFVIDYEFLRGLKKETVVKKLCDQRRRGQDVAFQEPLQDGGSRFVRERPKLGRRKYQI